MKKIEKMQKIVFYIFAKKVYMLAEELGSKRIDWEEEEKMHIDIKLGDGNSEKNVCNEN